MLFILSPVRLSPVATAPVPIAVEFFPVEIAPLPSAIELVPIGRAAEQ